ISAIAEPEKGPIASPASQFRFGLRKCNTNSYPTTSHSKTDATSSLQYSPKGSMRKIHSSHELNDSPQRFCNSPTNGKDSTLMFPMRRVSSSAHPFSDTNNDDEVRTESCLRWQQIVKDDLGLTGSMLLTTLSILKEARVKASNMNGRQENSSKKERHVTKLDSHDEHHGDGDETSVDDQLKNVASSSSLPSKQRNDDYSSTLKTLLSGIVKRNHLSVDDFLMQDARSVAERGQHSLQKETRETIDRYGEEVERCIDWVASGAVYLGATVDDENGTTPLESQAGNTKNYNSPDQIMHKQHEELSKRYILFKRMKQNMGHTALMLSGGGAQAMYHLGTIKALVESNLYQHIHVISGTSGGSIAAAMCAIKKPEELLRDICVNTVSTDYMLTGEMKRQGVSWFPSIYKMGELWMKTGLLMDAKEFLRCCQFYYSDITFEEAFEMTGKHICITVSASRAYAGSGVQRLLLNHISTPNVTLSSAVAASCAVPGVMAPAKLMIKDSRGHLVPFEVDGVEWIDGSVQADLPFKRISTLFNISNFVVCQTNFHVVPFLNKAHHPNIMCMWDVQSRVLNLSKLGLFPKIFGQDLSKMFTQKYYGKLTLVPRFTTMQLFGLKVLSSPTVADMDNYLQNGQLAAWPFLRVLQEMLRIERSIDAGLAKLDHRLKSVSSGCDNTLPNDDIDSLSSSAIAATYRARLPGLGREAELLKEKVGLLEQENKQLRQQVMRLQKSLGISHPTQGPTLEGKLISVTTVDEDDDMTH
ncbi:hypothetical protein ACHAXH_001520, partial [Discostella pseudostelligera]